MGRLETAQRIETERRIVFPETTVIIRDIQKLMAALGLTVQAEADDGGILSASVADLDV